MDAKNDLTGKALAGIFRFQAALAVLIFLPAFSLRYWQGWLFWLVFFASILVITLYFLKHDPALVRRRMKAGPTAEQQTSQKLIQLFAMLALCAVIILSALDHRYVWSSVSPLLAVAGDVLVVLGFAIVFVVFRENSFAASTITVAPDQWVIATGPYALVRHPMYAGAVFMFVGMPLALDSLWGLLPAALLMAVIIWRLLDEEQYLDRHLAGYPAYRQLVRSRLIPGIW